MEAGSLVKELSDEATCSICLEYFTDPVTIDCGHNFCQACLTQCWGESDTDASCPQCRETILQRKFKPNWQLANVVMLIKKHQGWTGAKGQRDVCKKHQEPLKLFCKDDRAPICMVCDRSKHHKDHNVIPSEEASQEYKQKIQTQLKFLEGQSKKLKRQKMAEEEKSQTCLRDLEAERQKIRAAFDRMRQGLEDRERHLLDQMADLEKAMKRRQEINVTRLSEDISHVCALIADMEEMCQQPDDAFLQGIQDILSRYEKSQPSQILEISPALEERLEMYSRKNSFLEKVVKKYEDFLEQTLFKGIYLKKRENFRWCRGNVTLDPDTAHPFLILSRDLKSVRDGNTKNPILKGNTMRFDETRSILGRQSFTSGRYWWEVAVLGKECGAWAVGVVRESVRRKGNLSFSPNEGVWAVGLTRYYHDWNLTAYNSPSRTTLQTSCELRKIRVYLDYENGCVEFFDPDQAKPIYTFPSASFGGEGICPFFLVGTGILTIA